MANTVTVSFHCPISIRKGRLSSSYDPASSPMSNTAPLRSTGIFVMALKLGGMTPSLYPISPVLGNLVSWYNFAVRKRINVFHRSSYLKYSTVSHRSWITMNKSLNRETPFFCYKRTSPFLSFTSAVPQVCLTELSKHTTISGVFIAIIYTQHFHEFWKVN